MTRDVASWQMAVVVLVLALLLCDGLMSDARSLQTHSTALPIAGLDADEHDNRWQATDRTVDSWRRPAGLKDSSYNRSRRSKRHYRAFVGVMVRLWHSEVGVLTILCTQSCESPRLFRSHVNRRATGKLGWQRTFTRVAGMPFVPHGSPLLMMSS